MGCRTGARPGSVRAWRSPGARPCTTTCAPPPGPTPRTVAAVTPPGAVPGPPPIAGLLHYDCVRRGRHLTPGVERDGHKDQCQNNREPLHFYIWDRYSVECGSLNYTSRNLVLLYMTSFKEIIQQFVGSTNVGLYMIHLERATDRVKDIDDLEHHLKSELIRFDAAEGKILVEEGHPTKCIYGGTRLPGEVGCTVSHIRVCKDALEKGYTHIVIFEDDCQATASLEKINQILDGCKGTLPPWDLFLMDASLIRNRTFSQYVSQIFNFNQSHAMIMNQTCMKALIALYEDYLSKGTTFAVDGMYSNMLEAGNVIAYGVRHKSFLFKQKHCFSYIINSYRNH